MRLCIRPINEKWSKQELSYEHNNTVEYENQTQIESRNLNYKKKNLDPLINWLTVIIIVHSLASYKPIQEY